MRVGIGREVVDEPDDDEALAAHRDDLRRPRADARVQEENVESEPAALTPEGSGTVCAPHASRIQGGRCGDVGLPDDFDFGPSLSLRGVGLLSVIVAGPLSHELLNCWSSDMMI